MERIFHYTSAENWERIKRSGFLMPRSDPNAQRFRLSRRLKSVVREKGLQGFFGRNRRYLVGVPEIFSQGYEACGFVDGLVMRTTGEVTLEVPVLDPEYAFVRDNFFISPKRLNDIAPSFIVGDDRRALITSMYAEYMESTTPLQEYDGSFVAPEVWLAQTTPVEILVYRGSAFLERIRKQPA